MSTQKARNRWLVTLATWIICLTPTWASIFYVAPGTFWQTLSFSCLQAALALPAGVVTVWIFDL